MIDTIGQPTPRTIVIVDDSPTIRKLVCVVLGRAGFAVIGCEDGVELLRWLHQAETRVPDLILLDIGLPKMDGYQVARALKLHARACHCPIAIISRRNGLLDRLKARLVGASSYLVKPFTTQQLLALVRERLSALETRNAANMSLDHSVQEQVG